MVAVVRGQANRGAKPQQRRTSSPRKGQASNARVSKFRASAQGAGLPPHIALYGAAGALVVAAGVALFTGDRLHTLGEATGQGMAGVMGKMGFRLASLKINGATPMAAADIARATGLTKDSPTLGVNLTDLRARVSKVGWVEDATVTRLLPSTIVITVKARAPVAVWQSNGVMRVVDAQGRVIPEASPASFPQLPLLVGEGANTADAGVLNLVRARPRLAGKLEALVRVDERRWDLRLKDGGIVQLPAVGEDEAMIRLDQLDTGQHLLDLGFERIDLRSPDMVVVRRGSAAASPMGAAA